MFIALIRVLQNYVLNSNEQNVPLTSNTDVDARNDCIGSISSSSLPSSIIYNRELSLSLDPNGLANNLKNTRR